MLISIWLPLTGCMRIRWMPLAFLTICLPTVSYICSLVNCWFIQLRKSLLFGRPLHEFSFERRLSSLIFVVAFSTSVVRLMSYTGSVCTCWWKVFPSVLCPSTWDLFGGTTSSSVRKNTTTTTTVLLIPFVDVLLGTDFCKLSYLCKLFCNYV